MSFKSFGKIPRLNRDIIITEKIDGTNACVAIFEDGTFHAQSRTRIVTPDDDNQGFAAWAHANIEALKADLGVGYHFGEWWGRKIGRAYGLDERRFSLFNVMRWGDTTTPFTTPNLYVVPVLYQGPWHDHGLWAPSMILTELKERGSSAVPGFMQAEGIVVYHIRGEYLFKATVEGDERGKDFGG